VNEIQIHPYFTSEPLLKFMNNEGITQIAYCPLGRGGTKEMGGADKNILPDPVITKIAESHQVSAG
jgi:diketogulonate reductase-like aldo/keto reductase